MLFDPRTHLESQNRQLDNTIDFSQRGRGKELMDLPCTYEDLRRCLHDPSGSRIRWKTGDAYSFDHESDPIDLVINSLLLHHMDDCEIPRFLMWMERVSNLGWFVNDLFRSHASYVAFQALAKLAKWHHFICHDGPLSIRRAFLPEDWRHYANAAGLDMNHISVDRHWPGRLTVSRNKRQYALSCTQGTLDEVPTH